MQISLDVKYHYDDYAVIGYALFEAHNSAEAFQTGQVIHQGVAPYESGQFYKRELPCLLHALSEIRHPLSLIYIDANVWLGEDRKGLGAYLYDALEDKVPVIGISKTKFFGESELIRKVCRGSSTSPLYISAIGISLAQAAQIVVEMWGEYRLPDMIKLADSLSRQMRGA